MSSIADALSDITESYLGLAEYPGAKANPKIIDFYSKSGNSWVQTDETPWCAAFVGACLAQSGVAGTGKLNARSYLDWGIPVPMAQVKPFDVVVFWRDDPNGPNGHVAFFLHFDGSYVYVRGGNQGDKVSDARFPISRIVGLRRAGTGVGTAPDSKRPLLRFGDKGAFVLDLQDQLSRLGYLSGKKDGDFGKLTKAAVMAFQSDNHLIADAIVGNATWAALKDAEPRPMRDVSADDLRQTGSSTIKATDSLKSVATGTGLLATAGALAENVTGGAQQATQAAQQAHGLLASLTTLVRDYWPAIALLGLAAVVYFAARKIEAIRVRDAQTGANLKR